MTEISEIFQNYSEVIEKDSIVRENLQISIKALEKTAYKASTILEKVHNTEGFTKLASVCEECTLVLKNVPHQIKELEDKIPLGEFYKYHYQFRNVTQKLVFANSFLVYLQESRLALYPEIASKMGLPTNREEGFHLDLEDYLHGTLFLGNELARLSLNAVSANNYTKPYQISEFIRELHGSYSVLNPKGELRKRFDELKYSLKKAEEVVYNLTLRGLKPQEVEDTSG